MDDNKYEIVKFIDNDFEFNVNPAKRYNLAKLRIYIKEIEP